MTISRIHGEDVYMAVMVIILSLVIIISVGVTRKLGTATALAVWMVYFTSIIWTGLKVMLPRAKCDC